MISHLGSNTGRTPRRTRAKQRRPGRGLWAGSLALGILTTTSAAPAASLLVDAGTSPSGNPHFWSNCVGTGTASLTLRADLQTHYQLANRELGMKRVRGHGVLNNDMGIFSWSGSGEPTYDFTNYDTYLAAIAAANMRPIIELSFMPTDLATQGGSINPPSDLGVYSDFIEAVVGHTVELFGEEDVSQWYWEVWNEPNYEGFWTGTMDDYFALYDAAVEGATRVLPEILVGGPVTTQGSAEQIRAFLQHVKENDTRVTFVSSHAYPGGAGTSAAATFGVLDNDSRRQVMESEGFGDLISMNTEWNTAYTGQGGNTTENNVSMDNHVNAPFILKSVKLLADQNQGDRPPLDIFSYWAVSDVFGEYNGLIEGGSYIETQGGGTLPFGSVFGLLTYQGVRKAAFNAFKMLNHLGEQRLAVSGGTGDMDGVDAMATLSEDQSELAVIVYNYFATINSSGEEETTVTVNDLPFAGEEVFVTQFIIDESHSNPYSVWDAQGRPSAPSEEQWRAMKEAQHLALREPVTTITAADSYTATFTLPRQAAVMILLSKERPVLGRDAFVAIEAEDHDGQAGITKQASGDETMGQAVMASAGASLYFHRVDFGEAGTDTVELRVEAAAATTLELRLDAADGEVLGTCDVAATAGQWATQPCTLAEASGVHDLHVAIDGALRLNWFEFERREASGGQGGSGGMPSAAGGPGVAGASGGTTAMGGAASNAGGGMTAGGGAPGPGGAGAPVVPPGPSTTGPGGVMPPPSSGTTEPGGTVAPGGESPSGGAAPGASAGSAGAGGADASADASAGSGGCGCQLTGTTSLPSGLFVLFGVGAGLLRRRRRRASSSSA